jgi:hypothetical protein
MLNQIETHLCNVCKLKDTVWCFTIVDGQMLQMCADCMASILAMYLSKMSEQELKNILTKKVDRKKWK